MSKTKNRCFGSAPGKEFYAEYHDKEWGIPVYDDIHLFEMLILEGAQAGLSWETILKRREEYRKAFHHFDPVKVAKMTDTQLNTLLENPGIPRGNQKLDNSEIGASDFNQALANPQNQACAKHMCNERRLKNKDANTGSSKLLNHERYIIRNRLKIYAARQNALVFLQIQKEFGSFSNYVWSFVNNQPIVMRRNSLKDIPTSTPESDALSKDLKKRGMSFVGSTIMYAFMQAVGLVNDHLVDCWCSSI